MSRELKFRAWDTTYRITLYSDSSSISYIFALAKKDNFTVLQYTGLKDKNGVEIYEGDIIQLEGSPISYSIEWDRYQWAINAHGALGYDPDWNIQPFNHCVYERAIVVGNIFENSDLLKQ
jgi:uncharacterized phage protein (TIGR01671 family)